MSHLHIPDGVLPLWLWLLGYILLSIYFILGTFYIKNFKKQSKFPLISIMTALMLLTMSIPLPFPVPYHINLSVLTGIILGPILSFFAIFTTNLILAFVVHGGITAIGLNTLVISIEAAFGYLIFKFFYKKTDKIFLSAFTATVLALLVSTFLNIGIVYTGTHNFSVLAHHRHHNCGLFKHNHEKEVIHKENNFEHNEKHHNEHEEKFNIKKFFFMMFTFGLIGWILEAFLTGFIVSYIKKVKPDILNL
jgi:cobalt/nickel transport system permease protein